MTAGLQEIATTLYSALAVGPVVGSRADALVILEDWLDALTRDEPATARLLDKRTPLTSWLVDQLVAGGIRHMRVAFRSAGEERVLDRELADLVVRHESELTERLTAQALGAQMAAIQRLTAGFAHELRNPVNAARLQLKLYERRQHDARGVTSMAAVFDELQQITDLLDDFLLFARPPPLERKDHEVVALVREAVAEERPFAAANGIELRFSTNTDDAMLAVDGSKLAFVVTELVHNAIEAGLHGGHVDIALDVGVDRLGIAVHDNGIGIAPELRTQIYEPFFSTRDHGRGLGLAIVHAFVAMQRGVIELDARPNQTSFAVTIPLRSPE